MSIWKEGKAYRYEFQVNRIRYTGTRPTKAEARARREEHKKEVRAGLKTPTGTGLQEAMNEYLDFCQRRFSDKNYRGKIYIFKCFLSCSRTTNIRNITGRSLEIYLSGLPRNTNYNRHRKALCALFAWAIKRGLIDVNPCVFVQSMPDVPTRKKIPSQEEMLKILLASGEHRPFFMCLYGLAARLGEINNLRWDDINFEKRIVTLWTRKGNGSYRAQQKALNDELYQILHNLWNKRCGEWVFPNPDTGLPYRNRRAQIRRVCATAGVPYYSWHCIRHHVASLLADIYKVDAQTIKEMLGHAQLGTTLRYIQRLRDGVRDAADLLQIRKPHDQTTRETEGES